MRAEEMVLGSNGGGGCDLFGDAQLFSSKVLALEQSGLNGNPM